MPSEKLDQLSVINTESSVDAVAVKQKAVGRGSALRVDSDSTAAPAVLVQGAGDLLDLRNASGVSQFSVTNAGNVAFNGTQDITGDVTITGALDVTGDATPGTITMSGAASTTDLITVRVTEDTDPQMVVNANGRIEWGGGSGAVDTALFRNGSAQLQTINDIVGEGNLIATTAGKGLHVKEGSNARMGTSTLVAGTVTVANTSVTANTRIFLTTQSLGTVAAPMAIAVTAKTASTSFVITSEDNTDTSVIAWILVEPSA